MNFEYELTYVDSLSQLLMQLKDVKIRQIRK